MGAAKEPRHPLEKRDLLHKDDPDTRRIDAIAAQLLEEGRAGEAVDYIEVTRTPALIQHLERAALEIGSPFLLQQVDRLNGGTHDAAAWTSVAEKAMAAGRFTDAVRALTAGGFEERAEEIRQEHCPEFEPFKPLGK